MAWVMMQKATKTCSAWPASKHTLQCAYGHVAASTSMNRPLVNLCCGVHLSVD
jgi:hypothetical protein